MNSLKNLLFTLSSICLFFFAAGVAQASDASTLPSNSAVIQPANTPSGETESVGGVDTSKLETLMEKNSATSSETESTTRAKNKNRAKGKAKAKKKRHRNNSKRS